MKYIERVNRVRRAMLATGAIVLLATLAACGGSGGSDESDARERVTPVDRSEVSASSTSAAATTSTSMPEIPLVDAPPMDNPTVRGVVEGYMAWRNAIWQVATDPNPDDPRLAATSTGLGLNGSVAYISELVDQKAAIRLPPDSDSEVRFKDYQLIGPDQAELEFCETNDGIRYRRSDGAILDDVRSVTRVRVDMSLIAGRWLLASGLEEVDSPCAQ